MQNEGRRSEKGEIEKQNVDEGRLRGETWVQNEGGKNEMGKKKKKMQTRGACEGRIGCRMKEGGMK